MGVVRRRTADGWEGVEPRAYPTDQSPSPHPDEALASVEAESHPGPAIAGVLKHELIGAADGAQGYEIRHFHVPPGGRTARERHAHDHGVMIISGRARVTLGEQTHELSPGDVVHVSGDELHCFEAMGDQPMGFVCVVPAKR